MHCEGVKTDNDEHLYKMIKNYSENRKIGKLTLCHSRYIPAQTNGCLFAIIMFSLLQNSVCTVQYWCPHYFNTNISIQAECRHLLCLVKMGCTCHTPHDAGLYPVIREKKKKKRKRNLLRLEMKEQTDDT